MEPVLQKPIARVFIDHQPIDTEMRPVLNPANTSEVIGYVGRGTLDHVEQAVTSSLRAFDSWAALTIEERGAYLASAIPEWSDTHAERARLLTQEQGKVLWESVADSRGPISITEYFLSTAHHVLADKVSTDSRGTIVQRQIPFGVTSVIVPWNTPIYLSFQHIAPALLSGNTVIVKPPENAPLSIQRTLEILSLKLPAGVLNIVPGSGSVVGSRLSSHPDVRKVLFTGSLQVGQTILAAAAQTVKSVHLELGGNDPAIILPDFDMTDTAIREIVLGTFTLTGQICFNIKRIYVHEQIREEFTARFIEAVDRICVGDGLDPRSTIGPVNNRKEYDRLQHLIESVVASGAIVRELGHKVDPENWDKGFFLLPRVVTDIDPTHELVVDEQFGPIVPIIGYTNIDEVLSAVNASDFGLGASIWTQNDDLAFSLGRQISAGTVFVNVHRMGASDMTMPFGGTKMSGLGRTHSSEILLECTEPQVIVKRIDTQAFPGAHLADGFFPKTTEGKTEA